MENCSVTTTAVRLTRLWLTTWRRSSVRPARRIALLARIQPTVQNAIRTIGTESGQMASVSTAMRVWTSLWWAKHVSSAPSLTVLIARACPSALSVMSTPISKMGYASIAMPPKMSLSRKTAVKNAKLRIARSVLVWQHVQSGKRATLSL